METMPPLASNGPLASQLQMSQDGDDTIVVARAVRPPVAPAEQLPMVEIDQVAMSTAQVAQTPEKPTISCSSPFDSGIRMSQPPDAVHHENKPAATTLNDPSASLLSDRSGPRPAASPVSDPPSSPLSDLPSSPLSERSSFTDEAMDSPKEKDARSSLLDSLKRYALDQPLIDCAFERDDVQGILVLKPTADQWVDLPAILAFATHHGALEDGCFKLKLPDELRDPIPEKAAQKVPSIGYRPKKLKNSFWRIDTGPAEGVFSSSEQAANITDSPKAALAKLKRLLGKNDGKRMRDVRYRSDVPAWTPEQRKVAGVPQRSPLHPLKNDELEYTRAIIPGIHTPYVYESAAAFGATFQIHSEDFKLISLNHLYTGRKIWIVNPCTAIDAAEKAFSRRNKCAQFMRHRAEFIFPDKLEKLGVPYRIVDQRPGETIVILPDAYHQGFSTGYTLAEAKNYADAGWKIDDYQPCEASCMSKTAISSALMEKMEEGAQRLDLCRQYELPVEMPVLPTQESVPEDPPKAETKPASAAPSTAAPSHALKPIPGTLGTSISAKGTQQSRPNPAAVKTPSVRPVPVTKPLSAPKITPPEQYMHGPTPAVDSENTGGEIAVVSRPPAWTVQSAQADKAQPQQHRQSQQVQAQPPETGAIHVHVAQPLKREHGHDAMTYDDASESTGKRVKME